MAEKHWKIISASRFPWEQEALDFIHAGFPAQDNYVAWSNFEFIADDGSINEIDTLIACPQGVFLIEIKSKPGMVSGDANHWVWESEGVRRSDESPLILANRKCKRLKSLLARQRAFRSIECPFIEPLVFLSHSEVRLQLQGIAASKICLRDQPAAPGKPERPGILAAIRRRECPGLPQRELPAVNRPAIRAFAQAMEQAGIRPRQDQRRVGDFVLDHLIFESPTGAYQDWQAHHVTHSSTRRVARIYQVARQAGEEERVILRNAARREFQVLELLDHPGILRADPPTDCEFGPVLFLRTEPDAQRLDQFMQLSGPQLAVDHRLAILRQIADTIRYAHSKHVVHRSLSPQSIYVRKQSDGTLAVQICNWQTSARLMGSTTTQGTRVSASLHAEQLVEDVSLAYLAPEALTGGADGGYAHDIFSLGAIAYLLFTGKPPAASQAELQEKLRAAGGLDIKESLDGAVEALVDLVQFSANGDVSLRDDIDQFLARLDQIEEQLTHPEADSINPLRASVGSQLENGFKVMRRLGKGATASALLVERQGQVSVLKVARIADFNARIKREFDLLKRLNWPQIVNATDIYEFGELHGFTMESAGDVTLAQQLRREPATPDDPAHGLVWSAILDQVDQPGSQSRFVSVADTVRASFHKHPWSIGGGGAAELKESMDEKAKRKLENLIEVVGVFGMSNADEVLLAQESSLRRRRVEKLSFRPAVTGDQIRDWNIDPGESAIFPYTSDALLPLSQIPGTHQWLWLARTSMGNRATFSKSTYFGDGLPWWKWHQVALERLQTPLSIVYSSVATHNHFVLDRGGNVFKQSSPLIKLAADAGQEDHYKLLGLFNSSCACFWMKQVFHNKGSTVDQEGARQRTDPFEDFFDFDTSKLKLFPIPSDQPHALAQTLDQLARKLKAHTPEVALATSSQHTRAALDAAKQRWTETLQRMIALQEELDWECYQLYSLTENKNQKAEIRKQKSEFEGDWERGEVPPLKLGERAFEIVMARKLATGELQTTWFERHGSKPITELPAHWPPPYRELVQRRIALMESDRNIALIEQPEYKRRWNVESWDEQLERALREWLLNRLECYFFGGERMFVAASRQSAANTSNEGDLTGGLPTAATGDALAAIRAHWPAGQQPALVSTNQLAAVVETDADFLRVAEIYSGGPGFSVSKLVRELVEAESVPFLPFQRYKDTGLRKRQDWEHVWDLQRKEDEFDAQIDPLKKELEEVRKKQKPDDDSPEAVELRKRELQLKDQIEVLKEEKKEAVGTIPVPPKYASGDFKKSHWWKLRGKLDVPKERWIVYPGAERDGDPSPVIAWAGWDHLQQAKALAGYYVDASTNLGWTPEKLQPLLTGLADLLPWLKQWHNEFDPEVTSGLGDYFAGFLDEEARKQGTTVEALNQLRLGLQLDK